MPDDATHLEDMLYSVTIAIQHLGDMTIGSFLDDIKTQDAIIRRIEIIGEASRRVSNFTKLKYPDVPWRDMKDMRNAMIHEYDQIDFPTLYEMVRSLLPKVAVMIEAILSET